MTGPIRGRPAFDRARLRGRVSHTNQRQGRADPAEVFGVTADDGVIAPASAERDVHVDHIGIATANAHLTHGWA